MNVTSQSSHSSLPKMSILTDEQRKHFIRHGYIILPNAVPTALLDIALTHSDAAYSRSFNEDGSAKSSLPPFNKDVKASPAITDLYYKTHLRTAAEQLLGPANAVVLGEDGQIAYTTLDHAQRNNGVSMTEPHPKYKWHVDAARGKYAAFASDFSFIIGVALSHGQHIDENRGQLIIYPGSHTKTHQTLRNIMQDATPSEIMQRFRSEKPDVGPPLRTPLHCGDAVIAHQRLAHCPGINLCDTTRKNVYFRIHHADRDNLIEDIAQSPTPWVGFYGLSDLLPTDATQAKAGGLETMREKLQRLLGARGLGEKASLCMHLSRQQKENFVNDGYIVVRNAVDMDVLSPAMRRLDEALASGRVWRSPNRVYVRSEEKRLVFLRPDRLSKCLIDIMLRTGLVDMVEGLLGRRNVVVTENIAEVVYVPTNKTLVEQGWGLEQEHPCNDWDMDIGKMRLKNRGLDHLVRIGVALSDGLDIDENRGQMVVWPGSHLKTHPPLADLMRNTPADALQKQFWKTKKCIDVGQPQRLLLRRGDVYIVHQRLATYPGANLVEATAKLVEFCVEHVDMDNLLNEFFESGTPFVGFEGLNGIVDL